MNRLQKRILTIVVVAMATVSANAQLTLDECQRLAAENYPLLRQYDLVRQTTDFTVSNISKGYLPQLTLSGQATYQSDVMDLPDALTGMFAQSGNKPKGLDKDQYRIALDVSQTIWDGGNIAAQKQAARAQGKVQEAQTNVSMYEVRSRVNDLFFGILLIEDRIRLNADLMALLKSNSEKTANLCKNGVAMQSDADMVRAEYLKAKQQHTELEAMKRSYVQMLALFLNKQPDEIKDLQKPDATLPAEMGNKRPELSVFDAQLQQNEAQRHLLSSGLLPRLSLFAQGYYGYPGYNMFDDMFSHDFSWNGMVGVRLTWNISRLYTHKTDRRKLDVTRSNIETARETFLFNNRLLTTQESSNIDRYHRLIAEDEEIITLRTSVRKAAEAKLEHGIIDVTNLLQYITQENQARNGQSTHEIEMLKHIYELKHTINQ